MTFVRNTRRSGLVGVNSDSRLIERRQRFEGCQSKHEAAVEDQ